MGYYVEGHGFIKIRKDNEKKAYQAMCALNDQDHLKRGGMLGSDISRSDGMDHHPNRWFSWMDPNYPKTCKDFVSVITELGFHFEDQSTSSGVTLYELSYESKRGQEELFLEAIAPYIEEGHIEWSGEEGARWMNRFENGAMTTLVGKVVYE